jgi:hypothetical protein
MSFSSIRSAICFALLAGFAAPTLPAQETEATFPATSHANRFGRGWECDRGYERAESGCKAIVLPDNAHISHSGSESNCNDGFERKLNTCLSR